MKLKGDENSYKYVIKTYNYMLTFISFHIYIFLKLKNIKIVVDINNDYMIL